MAQCSAVRPLLSTHSTRSGGARLEDKCVCVCVCVCVEREREMNKVKRKW